MSEKARSKKMLRRGMRQMLDELSEAEKESQSTEIWKQLSFSTGTKVAIFAGSKREPNLLPLMEMFPELLWHLPRVTGEDAMEFVCVDDSSSLVKGAFGIREPESGEIEDGIEVFLCPGVAFTHEGKRLGQGGGFYDRYLMQFPEAEKIGICFREQMVTELPEEEFDIVMDRVITSSPEPSA